jgi:hypothetical protein
MADPVVYFDIIGKLVVGQFTDPEGNLVGVASRK